MTIRETRSSPQLERRHAASEVRAAEKNGSRTVTLQPIVPNIVDDYGSVFMPDTFDASLEDRMPTLAWGHSWQHPIGRATGWASNGDLRSIEFRVADTQQARDAYALCEPGPNGEPPVIDDCSVGFSNTKRRPPTDEELERWPGAVEIIERADLDEVSLVLRGAVPGAKVLSLRSRDGRVAAVDEDTVMDVARKVAAGEMSEDEGRAFLNLIAEDDGTPAPTPEPSATDTVIATIDEALAEADAALDTLNDRSR
jgi:HK97 family phage prohead protease